MFDLKDKNFYKRLNLKYNATFKEINESYINNYRFYSDNYPDFPEVLALLDEAFNTLSDPELKEKYDYKLKSFHIFGICVSILMFVIFPISLIVYGFIYDALFICVFIAFLIWFSVLLTYFIHIKD